MKDDKNKIVLVEVGLSDCSINRIRGKSTCWPHRRTIWLIINESGATEHKRVDNLYNRRLSSPRGRVPSCSSSNNSWSIIHWPLDNVLKMIHTCTFDMNAQSQSHCIMRLGTHSNVSSYFDLIISRPN